MSFTARLSPARVTAAAAAMLPRAALLALLTAYALVGLFGRDPWYGDDGAGFGIMWTMAHGGIADWLLPGIAGEFVPEEGPLAFWLGALLIRLLGPLVGEPLAARLGSALWFALACTALWYATYRLARRDEAQPVAFAFGGEAAPRDYGRMIADVAALLFIATVGIVLRMHETTAETSVAAWVALALFGLAWSLDRPRRGSAVAGLASGGLALSLGPTAGVALLAATLGGIAYAARRSEWSRPERTAAMAVALLLAAGTFALWPLLAWTAPADARAAFFDAWATWARSNFALVGLRDLGWLARNGAWYLWPLWPLVLWALYAWRHLLAAPHIALPGIVAIAMLARVLVGGPLSDSMLVFPVVPLVVLAALGVPTLRRAIDNLMDWLAIATFTLFALAVWAYFVAMQTGAPPKMANSVMRLVPGLVDAPSVVALALAALVSAGWIALAVWRALRHPPMLWRGPLLAAGGLLTLWALLVLLFAPAVNYNRSYAPIAREIADWIEVEGGHGACIEPRRLLPPHRALFAYHGGLRFGTAADRCAFLLERESRRSALDDERAVAPWGLVWEGRFLPRPDEILRLYRRTGP